jgi:hypothetical protein
MLAKIDQALVGILIDEDKLIKKCSLTISLSCRGSILSFNRERNARYVRSMMRTVEQIHRVNQGVEYHC